MFLKPLSILLLFSLLTANCTNLFVYIGFEANQKYIAAKLCVNRDKPQLHCNGRCYLMKKLKQAQDKEQKQERQSQQIQLQVVFIETPISFHRYAFAGIKLHVPFSTGMVKSIKNSIFHPPQAS